MNFEMLLHEATRNIGANYFQLPIYGEEDPIYRERVYCYELYHQLRLIWPIESRYELSGEVDKAGHPLLRGNGLDRVKPDLLVHIPGNMESNHTIIEVKPISANKDGISKDLLTLTAFKQYANYENAIYLFYGRGDIDNILNTISSLCQDRNVNINLDMINIWWHREQGQPATQITLDVS